MRSLKWLLALVLLFGLGACATEGGHQTSALERAQYAWTAAIRWGDTAGAWKQLDPDYRARHALTDLEISRYKLVEVTGYTVLDSTTLGPEDFERAVEITVVNKKDMSARNVGYTERWHYDAANKAWWVTSGLPNYWEGR